MRNALLGAATLALGVAVFVGPAFGTDRYAGEIMAFGASHCPESWLEADGRVLTIDHDNQMLASLLRHRYGGDGARTFALPDLRNVKLGTQSVTWCIAFHGAYAPPPH